ncbi:MAG: hydrogenase maturation protease [Chloroflexi bacterium]|nr:hydrogenase maturation protease [Chloroflexota bacterium]
MARTLIVGYGNPLRADDGLGWHAAQQLAERIERDDVAIVTCHQLTPELAEAVSQVDLAIFIDAACVGEPGTFRCEEIQPDSRAHVDFTHRFDTPALLACAQVLYGSCPRAVLCSIAAESFDLTEDLSNAVQAALPTLVRQVLALIA